MAEARVKIHYQRHEPTLTFGPLVNFTDRFALEALRMTVHLIRILIQT